MSDLIQPMENETLQQYVARFIEDGEAQLAYPSRNDRKMVATYRFSKYSQMKAKVKK